MDWRRRSPSTEGGDGGELGPRAGRDRARGTILRLDLGLGVEQGSRGRWAWSGAHCGERDMEGTIVERVGAAISMADRKDSD
jgi:hypothetical protein